MSATQQCYCDPSLPSIGCNEVGCKTISALFLVFFTIPLLVCIYRLSTIRRKKDNLWSIVSHSFLAITCILRIVRSGCLLAKIEQQAGMGFLFIFPIAILICSYYNTLYVWIKIIHHVNFSKLVEKIFPFLGYTMIACQVILIALQIIGAGVYWSFKATNAIFITFIGIGAIGFAIFGKMIWEEYKDVSSKECGVFSESTNAKIQKVTKLSAAAIATALITAGVIIWAYTVQIPFAINMLMAFSFVGRGIEVGWITTMLFILSPTLQTWNSASQRAASSGENFDDLSDSSIDIENEKTNDGVPPSSQKVELQANKDNQEGTIGGSDV